MASRCDWQTLKLYITSYHADFDKERELLLKEVIPSLQSWCEAHGIELQETDVRWGGYLMADTIQNIHKGIEQSYHNNVQPFFINITSDSLGLLPTCTDDMDSVIEVYQRKLRLSSSEVQMLQEAYSENNPNGLVLVREDHVLDDLLPGETREFVNRGIIPMTVCRDYFTQRLQRYPCKRVARYSYKCEGWDSERNRLIVKLTKEEFADKILEFVKTRIGTDFSSKYYLSCDKMRKDHTNFMERQSATVKGRNNVLEQIEDYVRGSSRDVPLLVKGGAGCGKTAVMAAAADYLQHKIGAGQLTGAGDSNNWHIFYHFVGAVPQSNQLEAMLKRLFRELDVELGSVRETNMMSTSQRCCDLLSSVTTRPVILIVDGIDQFDCESAAKIMSWVPCKLGPHVRCIFSVSSEDSCQHQVFMERESKPQMLDVPPLDMTSGKLIVDEMLHDEKRLSERQMNSLLSKQWSGNALGLTLACHELQCVSDTGDDRSGRIDMLPDDLLDLLDGVLERLAHGVDYNMFVATLCLLVASNNGLTPRMLLSILSQGDLSPPSPYDEKDETESSEKERLSGGNGEVSADQWRRVYSTLEGFLRPIRDSRAELVHVYHPVMTRVIRRIYFKCYDDNEPQEESAEIFKFWHQKLVNYFEQGSNKDGQVEEYLHQLSKVCDSSRLAQVLCDWDIFDKFYNDKYSFKLLKYWRQVGDIKTMMDHYTVALSQLEMREPRNEKLTALRYEHVARVFLQSGKYAEALTLSKVALKWEEKELGNRPERMVELYSLMGEIYDEKLKLNDFVSDSQLPDLRKTISYGRKSISLRKTFNGKYHQFKLGMSLMKLSFSLESWEACGGDSDMTRDEAVLEAGRHIESALQIFQELNDMGHYAEALMTKGVLARRGSMEQLKLYNEARELCLQVYGECSLLISRLYINIGIVYEDNNDYVKAYNYFMRWARVSEAILGPQHPKTLRAKGVLKEPRYSLVAERLRENSNGTTGRSENQDTTGRPVGDNQDNTGRPVGDNQDAAVDEESINQEVSELLEFNSDDGTYDANLSDMVTREDIDVDSDIDDHGGGESNMLHVTTELQQAINQLLRRALGELNNSGPPGAELQLDNRLEESEGTTDEDTEDEDEDTDTEIDSNQC